MNPKHKSIAGYLGWPGLVSMLSLLVGWIAIVLLIMGFPLPAITASIAAFFLDCLDGAIARKTDKESDFGRQLDGMFDFLNYSGFSALLFWLYVSPNILGVAVGFFILATGAFRLTRFNIEGYVTKNGEYHYAGIVVCHISLTVIVLYFLQQFYPALVEIIAIPITLIISALQASRVLVKKTNFYHIWLSLAFLLLLVSLGLQLWPR